MRGSRKLFRVREALKSWQRTGESENIREAQKMKGKGGGEIETKKGVMEFIHDDTTTKSLDSIRLKSQKRRKSVEMKGTKSIGNNRISALSRIII